MTTGDSPTRHHQQHVEWEGDWWQVVDARYDDSGMAVGSHWHLTITGPVDGEVLRDATTAGEIRRDFAHHRRNPRCP